MNAPANQEHTQPLHGMQCLHCFFISASSAEALSADTVKGHRAELTSAAAGTAATAVALDGKQHIASLLNSKRLATFHLSLNNTQ